MFIELLENRLGKSVLGMIEMHPQMTEPQRQSRRGTIGIQRTRDGVERLLWLTMEGKLLSKCCFFSN